jgi:hypothetical protein
VPKKARGEGHTYKFGISLLHSSRDIYCSAQKHLQKENKVSIKKEKEIKKQKIEKSKKFGPKR